MPGVNNKYTNVGMARWENANVGVIKWDPDNKVGEASVIDETTGTVYEIGGGGGGESKISSSIANITLTGSASVSDNIYGVTFIESDMVIVPLSNLLETSGEYEIILYEGEAAGTFITSQSIATYDGDIVLGQPEIEDDTYYTPFTISGDCSVTLIGSGSN